MVTKKASNEVRTSTLPMLHQLRTKFIMASKSTEGSLRAYTEELTRMWGENWWLVKADGRILDDNQKALLADIKTEKKTVQALAKARKLSNIDKPWSDVLKYARGAKGKGVPGARREIVQFLTEEAVRLYTKGMKFQQELGKDGAEDMCPPGVAEATTHFGRALKALGYDLSTINLTK